MQIINTEESDYSFLVTITSELVENLELKDIPCNVALPKETIGEITLQFFLTKEQYEQSDIKKVWNFSASGERKETGLTYQKIIADKIVFLKTKQIHDNFFVITGMPVTLYLENHYSSTPETTNLIKTNKLITEFQLTPSQLLKPFRDITDQNKYLRQPSIKLSDGNTIVFDDRECKYQDEKGSLITTNSLVACCETLENGSQENVQKVSDLLDDVLLITSFAEGRRCLSLGWNTYDCQMKILYFRRDKVIPSPLEGFWLNKIIEPEYTFDAFLKTAYENFCLSDFKPNIRRAINSLFKTRETFESEFMSLYAGLESLVLGFRQSDGLEFVFSQDNGMEDEPAWEEFKKALKQWVKEESPLKNNEEFELEQQKKIESRQKLLLKNLSALRRVSFRVALDKMRKEYKFDLRDLWSVTDSSNGWSLSEIRNKIVHGATFIEPTKHRHLEKAMYHLRWTLTRIILGVLGWDIENSDVSKTKLANMKNVLYENWEESKKYISI